MSEAPEQEPPPSDESGPVNPHSEHLDVEGPNESAPGHEPDEQEDEQAGTDSPESGR